MILAVHDDVKGKAKQKECIRLRERFKKSIHSQPTKQVENKTNEKGNQEEAMKHKDRQKQDQSFCSLT